MFEYKSQCTSIVDGDTVDLMISLGFSVHVVERARLIGIDTPESRTTNLLEKRAGLTAKAFLKSLIENKVVYVRTTKEEKYGRYLADIFLDKEMTQSVNQMLIDKGLARPYNGEERIAWTNEQLNRAIEAYQF